MLRLSTKRARRAIISQQVIYLVHRVGLLLLLEDVQLLEGKDLAALDTDGGLVLVHVVPENLCMVDVSSPAELERQ